MRTNKQGLEGGLRLEGGLQEINQGIEEELEGSNGHLDMKRQRDVSSIQERNRRRNHIHRRRKFEAICNKALLNGVEPKTDPELEAARKDFIEMSRASYKVAIMSMGCGDDSPLLKALDDSMCRYATRKAFLRTLQEQHSHSESGGSSHSRSPHGRSHRRSNSSSRRKSGTGSRNSGSSLEDSSRSFTNSIHRGIQSQPRRSARSHTRQTEKNSDGWKKVRVLTSALGLLKRGNAKREDSKREDSKREDSKRGEIPLIDNAVKRKPETQHSRGRHG
jgi:hypothetical protein